MTLILSRMIIVRGYDAGLPEQLDKYRTLRPRKFLLDCVGDAVITCSGNPKKVYDTVPKSPKGFQGALLLNHGRFDGNIYEFTKEHGDGLSIDFRGVIKNQDNLPRMTGDSFGAFCGTTMFAFWDYPPYGDDDCYIQPGESPWTKLVSV